MIGVGYTKLGNPSVEIPNGATVVIDQLALDQPILVKLKAFIPFYVII